MESAEFRINGKKLVDFIADYLQNIESHEVTPNVKPGYLFDLLPNEPPQKRQSWDSIMKNVENAVMTGIVHKQHPGFHGYYPAGNSYSSILGNFLADSLGVLAITWDSNPAGTELEMLVCDWLAKMVGLPPSFTHQSGAGGGVIQSGASESVLVAMYVARHTAIIKLKKKFPSHEDGELASKLVAYGSKLVNHCFDKASKFLLVKIRHLECDDNFSLRGPTLQAAIEEDSKKGLYPFYVCASVGTSSVCSYDNMEEIAAVCRKNDIWLHVDAAYAGNALICPEFKHLAKGIENADSININPSKFLLVQIDSAILWFQNKKALNSAMLFSVPNIPDGTENTLGFKDWGISMTRRFRALKIWSVFCSYGVEGLQNHVRKQVNLAKKFEELVKSDSRFEIIGKSTLGLVCFQFQESNKHTAALVERINKTRKVAMFPAEIGDKLFIRFVVFAEDTNEGHIIEAWKIISDAADKLTKSSGS